MNRATPTPPAAVYVRVSAKEETVANQELELRRWATRVGLEVVKVYADTASGSRGDRVALSVVLAGAHRRKFDILLIWSLDRLSREGVGPMVRCMDQLRAAGVRVQSNQETWVDTAHLSGISSSRCSRGWRSRSASGSASRFAPAKPGPEPKGSVSAGSLVM